MAAPQDRGTTGPTIYDVARAAGVATSTVSRSHNNPGRVAAGTRERVLRIASELGYQPSPHARAPTSSRTRTLAMVVSDITDPHSFEQIRGAELRAKASEHVLVLVNAEGSPDVELQQVHRLAGSVDGFVLASSRLRDDELLEVAATHAVVLVDRQVRGLASVVLDQVTGCRDVVDHLAALGHQSLVHLAGPRHSWTASRRWAALRDAAEERGVAAHRLGPYPPTVASGGAAADAALRCGARALVAHNDLLAIGVLRRLAERSVRVPQDVSVVGFDDIFAADLCTPALTTLGGPHAQAGRAAVEVLLSGTTSSRTDGWSPLQSVLPTSLVVRSSTGPAR